MKTSSTIILLVIAAVVVAAVYFQKRSQENQVASAAIPTKTLPAITSGTLERIVIRPPGEKAVTLHRSEDKWFLDAEGKYEADQAAVNNAINSVSQPVETTIVSTNPDSFDDYQVSETTATAVQMFEQGKNNPALDLLIGKDGPSAFTTYVRQPDSDEVLNARSNFSMAFKRPDGWRNRQMFSFSSSNAIRVDARGTSGTFTLEKQEEKWHLTAPEPAEAQDVASAGIVNMMASLRATDFVDIDTTQSLESMGLEPPRQTLEVAYEDKTTSPSKTTTVTLLIGNLVPDQDNWYAKRADRPDVFMIGNYMAESLLPAMDELRVSPSEAEQTDVPAEEVAPEEGETTTSEDSTTTAAEQPAAPSEQPAATPPAQEPEPQPQTDDVPTTATSPADTPATTAPL